MRPRSWYVYNTGGAHEFIIQGDVSSDPIDYIELYFTITLVKHQYVTPDYQVITAHIPLI